MTATMTALVGGTGPDRTPARFPATNRPPT